MKCGYLYLVLYELKYLLGNALIITKPTPVIMDYDVKPNIIFTFPHSTKPNIYLNSLDCLREARLSYVIRKNGGMICKFM